MQYEGSPGGLQAQPHLAADLDPAQKSVEVVFDIAQRFAGAFRGNWSRHGRRLGVPRLFAALKQEDVFED